MTNIDGYGPAFPVSIPGCGDNGQEGMTLRDYFAAQFMPSAFVSAGTCAEYDLRAMFGERTGLRREEIAAALAYRFADAMVARRSR